MWIDKRLQPLQDWKIYGKTWCSDDEHRDALDQDRLLFLRVSTVVKCVHANPLEVVIVLHANHKQHDFFLVIIHLQLI